MEKSNEEVTQSIPSRAQIATYCQQIIPEYCNNPFIEALPSILSKEEAIDRLCSYPEFESKERYLDSHFRYHLIQRLFRYFQPLQQHIDLEQRVSRLLRQGYLGRNPYQKDYFTNLDQVREQIEQSGQKDKITASNDQRKTAQSFTMIGISGIGKTTAIEKILSLYPQIIIHETPLNLYQLVWLKLDCPFDGSVKGLCIQFFSEIDKLFGTNYKRKFGASSRQSVDAMLPNMAHVAFLHGLGVLVIDEIQHLSAAKSGGAEKMLNFFVTLVNTIGVPVIAIGTPKALPILQSEFRQARRGTGQGDMIWNCMKRDTSWELLIEGMWEYQWTRQQSPITEEIRNVLYDESQGIVDMAVKIYMLSQIRAVSSGLEIITPELIRMVAKDSLQLTQPMIAALKAGKLSELAKYDDIRPINMDEQIQKYTNVGVTELIRLQRLKEAEKRQQSTGTLIEQIILALLKMDIDSGVAQKAAEQVLAKYGTDIQPGSAVKEAVKLALTMEAPEQQQISKKDKKQAIKLDNPVENTDQRDMRIILKLAKMQKVPAYDTLDQAGLIKSPLKDFAL